MKKFTLLFIIPLFFGIASCEQADPIEPEPAFYIDQKRTNVEGSVYQVDITAAHLGVYGEYDLHLVLLLQSDDSTTEYVKSFHIDRSEWSYFFVIEVDTRQQIKWIKIEESQSSITLVDNGPPEGWEK